MNATGGSLVTVVKYLLGPRRAAPVDQVLQRPSRCSRARCGSCVRWRSAEIYTLWMDPVLNTKAYILPGLGDAGDRDQRTRRRARSRATSSSSSPTTERSIVSLYREQVRRIEQTVLGA